MKYSEKQLEKYASPIGQTEEEKCKHAISMVRDALKYIGYSDDNKEIRSFAEESFSYALDMRKGSKNIVILVQGSYANKTNIPKQSDVDVAVILESTFIPEYRAGVSGKDYGFSKGTYTAKELKDEVEDALRRYYKIGVERHDKSIKVFGNSYRVDADVVPAYRYRNYLKDYNFDESNYEKGIEIRPDSGGSCINYPEQHIQLGIAKNRITKYQYKKIVRIIKSIKEDMIMDGIRIPQSISSFGIESLLWNVDVSCYTKYSSMRFITDDVVEFLLNNQNKIGDYVEANGIKKLCQNFQMEEDYRLFAKQLREFFEYEV